jgi:transcription elongation factor GreA
MQQKQGARLDMNSQPNYLTFEGKKKLEEELQHLTTTARKELAERLRFAIKQGDLSENADYAKAKEDQAFLEGRIRTIEAMLRNTVIVEEARAETVASDQVHIGCKVTVAEEDDGVPETYMIVGPAEADPKQGKISHASPLGNGLIGKRVGEKVVVAAPGGDITFEIVKIE